MKQWFAQHRKLLWALFCSFALCACAIGLVYAGQGNDRFDLFVRIFYLICCLYYTVRAWWAYRQHLRTAQSVPPSATDVISH